MFVRKISCLALAVIAFLEIGIVSSFAETKNPLTSGDFEEYERIWSQAKPLQLADLPVWGREGLSFFYNKGASKSLPE